MNLETIIQKKVHALPTSKQEKVLEYVEGLEDDETNGYEMQSSKKTEVEKEKQRLSIIGIINTGKSDISSRVDEILAEGINKKEGWSLP